MQKISLYTGSLYQSKLHDNEWLNIIRRLKSSGYSSTGTKAGDYALLKKLENQKAASLSENQIIQDKKETKTENNRNNGRNILDAADKLGEQLFLTVKINNMKNINMNKM